MKRSMEASSPPVPAGRGRQLVSRVFGFSGLIVSLGVGSALVFSLSLFIAAIVQAYQTIREAMTHLQQEGTVKHLMIAAVEQTDVLLVALALLIISTGMFSLFLGSSAEMPAALRIRTFDDLKQKLIGIVIVALAVNFFSVALEWKGGNDILVYGLALAAVILAVGTYSVILSRLGHGHGAEDDEQ